MPLLEWKGEFETGIAYIDYEHRRLVDLINQTCENLSHVGSEGLVAQSLGQLHAQISAHFALEERLMQEKKYQFFEAHKADHEQLLEEMRYMMDAYEAGMCESCGTTLDACLTSWFRKHFRTKDARFETLRL